jgi:zinc transport system substrate-binding protein
MIMRLVLIALVAGVLGASSGCGGSSAAGDASGKQLVVTSFYPLAYAAEQIGGSRVVVRNLTPPGSEPHDLELSPSDVAEINEADLVLLIGRGFQPQLEEAAGKGEDALRVLDAPGLALRSNGDPHVWLDPLRYAKIVARIGRSLGNEAAAGRLVGRLQMLDREYRRGLADCERHDIVTSHEAFGYLAERYGLRQIAITGLSPEAEPDPGRLQQVVDLVRERGVTTIFFETLVSPRIADTVARETGATTAVLNPIEGLTEADAAQGDDYFSLMRENLGALRGGLGCR